MDCESILIYVYERSCNIGDYYSSVDSQPMMEETILVGDDLMMGPPSPVIPPEIASHVLQGVELCDGILRNLFLCKSPVYLLQSPCIFVFGYRMTSHLSVSRI